jgi:hypothetical protein
MKANFRPKLLAILNFEWTSSLEIQLKLPKKHGFGKKKIYLGNQFTLGPTAHATQYLSWFWGGLELPKFELLRKLARFSTLGSNKLGS